MGMTQQPSDDCQAWLTPLLARATRLLHSIPEQKDSKTRVEKQRINDHAIPGPNGLSAQALTPAFAMQPYLPWVI